MSEPVLISIVTSISLCLLFVVIKFLKNLWWSPRRIQKVMASQGIKGPPYRFIHGNTKEMEAMRSQVMVTPSELSHHIFPRIVPHFYSWIRLYGVNLVYWIGLKPQLVVTDPELAKVVLNNREGLYQKTEAEGFVKKLIGNGIVRAEGDQWLKKRKLAFHAFNKDNLKGMTEEMVTSVEMMLERWRSHVGKEMEVFQEFKLLTSEVISRTAFGSNYLEGEKIFDMLTKMINLIMRSNYGVRVPIIGKFLKTKDDVESDMLEQGIRDAIIDMIRKREEKVRDGEVEDYGSDFLGSLVSAYHSDDETKKYTIDDMVDECKTMYLAGQETTNVWLCWTMFLLALHPDWQDKAREEVLEVFGQENPNLNGLAKLTTMTMIMNESIRLYPPVVSIERKPNKEVKLGNIVVPMNMEVNVSSIALHHDPEIWGDDAHMFKPERFAEGVAKATNNKTSAYIPFGLGARACLGQNFAINEMKIALSMILQRYRFALSPNYVHSPAMFASIHPLHGLLIILHPL